MTPSSPRSRGSTRIYPWPRPEEAAFDALLKKGRLSDALVPVRLWTVMTVDHTGGAGADGPYSNMPDALTRSQGTKPIVRNAWFEIVHGQHRSFVANTLADIAAVFP